VAPPDRRNSLREARRVAEIEPSDEAVDFARRLRAFYARAQEIANRNEPWRNTPGDFLGLFRRFENLATREDLRTGIHLAWSSRASVASSVRDVSCRAAGFSNGKANRSGWSRAQGT